MRIRNLLMSAVGAGVGAMLGLAICEKHTLEHSIILEQNNDSSEIYEQLNALKPTARVQTNPLEKHGGSYYV